MFFFKKKILFNSSKIFNEESSNVKEKNLF